MNGGGKWIDLGTRGQHRVEVSVKALLQYLLQAEGT